MISLVTFFMATWSFVGCVLALLLVYDMWSRK